MSLIYYNYMWYWNSSIIFFKVFLLRVNIMLELKPSSKTAHHSYLETASGSWLCTAVFDHLGNKACATSPLLLRTERNHNGLTRESRVGRVKISSHLIQIKVSRACCHMCESIVVMPLNTQQSMLSLKWWIIMNKKRSSMLDDETK